MAFLRDGLDWGGRSGRGAFALALALWAGLSVLAEHLPDGRAITPLFWALAAPALVLYAGHARRRLRDMGVSGWVMWLLLVPVLSLALALLMVVRKGTARADRGTFSRAARIAVWLLALGLLSRIAWSPYHIPASSMKPALLVGDYILVTHGSGQPARGDVVVFRHPVHGTGFVKRVIGLSGETVQMAGGVPVIDGTPLAERRDGVFTESRDPQGPQGVRPRCIGGPDPTASLCIKDRWIETTPEGRSYPVLDLGPGPGDEGPAVTVPEGHVFVLGDNRDNSVDSRIAPAQGGTGFVPIGNILGVARRVALNPGTFPNRLWRRIE